MLRDSSPSRYLTETGSWERQLFEVPNSRRRLEEYAQATESRRNTSLVLQEQTCRGSSVSPARPRAGKTVTTAGGDGSPNTSGVRANGRGSSAMVGSSASAPVIGAQDPRSDGSLPPIMSQSRYAQRPQLGRVGVGEGDPRNRTATPSFGQEPTVRGPVRGWASVSPDRESSGTDRYGPGNSTSWYQRTRPNWYGLDSRTQHAF